MTTLIIPIYNGAKEVLALFAGLDAYLAQRVSPLEVLIIDDGSTDSTGKLLQQNQRPWLRVITLQSNCGKGVAVAKGVESAQGSRIIFTDADLPYDLGAIDAIELALESVDIALGSRSDPSSRFAVNISLKRKIASALFSRAANFVLLSPIQDTQCGIKGFTHTAAKNVFNNMHSSRFCFDVEILLRAQLAQYQIAILPVFWKNNDSSSVSLMTDSILMLRDLCKLYIRTRFYEKNLSLYTQRDSPIVVGMGFLLAILSLPIFYNIEISTHAFISTPIGVLLALVLVWMLIMPILTFLFFRFLHLFPLPKKVLGESARYILVGIFNTALNTSVFNILIIVTNIARGDEILAFSFIAYGITIAQAFWWNKHWVFNHAQYPTTKSQYLSFLAVTVCTALISSACTYALVTLLGAPAEIPQRIWANIALAIIIPVSFTLNFLGNKFFVFRNNLPNNR